MKKICIITAIVITLLSLTTCKKDKAPTPPEIKIHNIEPTANYDGIVNGYHYIDLGLPSGLKWAIYNIGASLPEENGNLIFLPAAGYRYESLLYDAGNLGYYWISAPYDGNTDDVYYLCFYSGNHDMDWFVRSLGRAVRPVTK